MVAPALKLHVADVEVIDARNGRADVVGKTNHLPIEDRIAVCFAGAKANHMFASRRDQGCFLNVVPGYTAAERERLRKSYEHAGDFLMAHEQSVHEIAGWLLRDRKINLKDTC